MSLAASTLTASIGTSDPQATASISPTTGGLLLLTIGMSRSGTPAPDDSLSVSGLGGTWTKLATAEYGARRRAWLYQGVGCTGTGTISIDYTGANAPPQEVGWVVDEFTGQDPTTPTASAVVSAGQATSRTITTGGTPAAGDATHSSICTENNNDCTVEGGWAPLGQTTTGSLGVRRVESAWDDAADPSHAWTWGGSDQTSAAFLVIVKAAAGGGPTQPNFDQAAVSTSTANRSATGNISHTVTGGKTNVVVLAFIASRGDETISGGTPPTYAGSAMTLLGSIGNGATNSDPKIWVYGILRGNTTGTNNCVVTYGANVNPDWVVVVGYSDCVQTLPPSGDVFTNTGTSNSPSVAGSSLAAGSILIGAYTAIGGDVDPSTPGTGVTERQDVTTGTSTTADDGGAVGEVLAASGSATYAATMTASDKWAAIAVEIALVITGTTHQITAAGAATTTGAAAATLVTPTTHQITAAGTGSTTASATAALLKLLSASGAAASSGAAGVTLDLALAGSGSVATTGQAVVTATLQPSAAGAAVVVASAQLQLGTTASAAGAAPTTGTAAAVIVSTITAAGFVSSSGTAAVTSLHSPSASGTASTSGVAAVTLLQVVAAAGSATTSGAAAATLTLVLSAAGTASTAASAAAALLLVTSASGATTTAGTAAVSLESVVTHQATAGGTSTTAGAAVVTLDLVVAGAGSAASSGAAAATALLSIAASGTASTSGAAIATIESGAVTLQLTAGGSASAAGASSISIDLSPAAAGATTSSGTATVTVTLAASATGAGLTSGSAALSLLGGLSGAGNASTSGAASISMLPPVLLHLAEVGSSTSSTREADASTSSELIAATTSGASEASTSTTVWEVT